MHRAAPVAKSARALNANGGSGDWRQAPEDGRNGAGAGPVLKNEAHTTG